MTGLQVGENLHIPDLDYADDIDSFADNETAAQTLIDQLSERADMLGLTIKPSKTQAICFHVPIPPRLSVDGENIEVTSDFCYLGSLV